MMRQHNGIRKVLYLNLCGPALDGCSFGSLTPTFLLSAPCCSRVCPWLPCMGAKAGCAGQCGFEQKLGTAISLAGELGVHVGRSRFVLPLNWAMCPMAEVHSRRACSSNSKRARPWLAGGGQGYANAAHLGHPVHSTQLLLFCPSYIQLFVAAIPPITPPSPQGRGGGRPGRNGAWLGHQEAECPLGSWWQEGPGTGTWHQSRAGTL